MTQKQKVAASKIVENGGNISKAMIEAGYSPATAKTPQKLTKSKGWKALVEKYLPDDKLLIKHEEALEAMKVITSHTEPDYEVPDHTTRLKAVDMAYKIKGKHDVGISITGEKVIAILGGATLNDPATGNSNSKSSQIPQEN